MASWTYLVFFAVTAATDSLGKDGAFALAAVIQNDIFQRQAIGAAFGVCLHLDHGGVIPASGSVTYGRKIISTSNCDRLFRSAGDGQVLVIEPGALGHGQVRHDVNGSAVLGCVHRLGQGGVGIFLAASSGIIAAIAAYIDSLLRRGGGNGSGELVSNGYTVRWEFGRVLRCGRGGGYRPSLRRGGRGGEGSPSGAGVVVGTDSTTSGE